MPSEKNFALTGVAGFVAERHLKAINATGNRLVAPVDPHDALGILDRYSFNVRFFNEFERFDRPLEKLRRGPPAGRAPHLHLCFPQQPPHPPNPPSLPRRPPPRPPQPRPPH